RRKYYELSKPKNTNVCRGCGKEYQTTNSESIYCSVKCKNKTEKKSHEEFVMELFQIHKGWIVPLEQYKSSNSKLTCLCLKCGNKMTKPAKRYIGSYRHGCRFCSNKSHGEDMIAA